MSEGERREAGPYGESLVLLPLPPGAHGPPSL